MQTLARRAAIARFYTALPSALIAQWPDHRSAQKPLPTRPQPHKIIPSADNILILHEAQAGLRQIFTDGRTLPPGDPQPRWHGYSAGH